MAPLPGSPTPNPPGTGSPVAPAPPTTPSPMAQNPQGARTPTGLPYGQHQALQQAQQQMPVSGPATPGMPPGGAPGIPPMAPDHPQVLQAAQGFNPPIQPLTRPSERPHEPVTSGIPLGAGPGPEALNHPSPTAQNAGSLSALLAQIALQSGSNQIAHLAQDAAAKGQ